MKIKSRKDALLKLFIDIGGEGDRELINSKVPEYWELKAKEYEIEKGVGKPLYWHRIASSSQQLKDKDGYLENPERGVWKITDAGKNYIIQKLGLANTITQTTNGPVQSQSPVKTTSDPTSKTFTPLKEEDFYAPFADWIVNSLEECTRAVPLGGKIFQDKWGTPDVIGIRSPRPSAIIKPPTEIISAEIKTNTLDLIQAFGQANAYKLFSHKSYIVIPNTSSKEEIARLDVLSRICGIGLILFDNTSVQEPKFEIRVRASRHEPDMFYIERYMKLIEDDLFPNK
ncbi:MAG: winged helix-turn-helix domain-containing protein [Thermodesulfovibrionia bacterium]|nr:winged helix-turn-helix domain-containing protein [Thermodesulfovibrionia bacterium]